jgi:hypothetical protein
VIPPEDVNGVSKEIVRSLELWERGDLKIQKSDLNGIDIFDRRTQAGQMADILDSLATKTAKTRRRKEKNV